MAKEVAIGKRAKISQAQQSMMIVVAGVSVVLGVAVSLSIRFVQQISFNSKVIAAEEKSIVQYSDVIKSIGICKAPEGTIYSERELKDCDPDSIDVNGIPDTLRYNILVKLAANKALNSVPKEALSECIDPATKKNYTYEDLDRMRNAAKDTDKLSDVNQLIKSCSALRVIPDALPAYENQLALLASLNNIFLTSGWQPESLSPGDASKWGQSVEVIPGLNALGVNLSIQADASVTKNTLSNIERSIREFDIGKATIEWEADNTLSFNAQAVAYYMDEATLSESSTTITEGGI